MIKISSVENVYEDVWDHMGKSNLVQIFISYEDFGICFVQFVYDEGGKLVLSERPAGTKLGSKFHTIKLNYKEEFLTSLAGTYRYSTLGGYFITSLSFGTNRVSHGPFGSPGRDDKKFDFQLGQDRALGGFHGTTRNGVLQSIGVYVKPLTSSTSSITI